MSGLVKMMAGRIWDISWEILNYIFLSLIVKVVIMDQTYLM